MRKARLARFGQTSSAAITTALIVLVVGAGVEHVRDIAPSSPPVIWGVFMAVGTVYAVWGIILGARAVTRARKAHWSIRFGQSAGGAIAIAMGLVLTAVGVRGMEAPRSVLALLIVLGCVVAVGGTILSGVALSRCKKTQW